MSTTSTEQLFTTRDVKGHHIAAGMFVIHLTSMSTATVHSVSQWGDVVVFLSGSTVPLTTRGVFLEAMVNIKCAHCKEYHHSISEVRECGNKHNAAQVFAEPVPAARPAHVTLRENAKRDSVPAGRYAVEIDGALKFYRVSRPTEGKWSGRVFVDLQVSDDFVPTFNRAQREAILGVIAQDPRGASLRYGHQIGSCGVCGRTLTNEESRMAGIGPVCAAKFGW